MKAEVLGRCELISNRDFRNALIWLMEELHKLAGMSAY